MIDIATVEEYVRAANPIPDLDDVDADEFAVFVVVANTRRAAVMQAPTQHPTTTPTTASPQRRRKVWAFAVAFIVVLVGVGIAALVLRTAEAPVSDEPVTETAVAERSTEVFFDSEPGMVRHPVPAGGIHSPAVGLDGSLWAVGDGEVLRFDGKTWTRYGVEDGLLAGTIVAVDVGGDGTVWVTHEDGASRFDEQGWTVVASRSWPAVSVVASDGSLWAVDEGQLAHFTDTDAYEAYPLDLPYGEPASLAVGPDGVLWLLDSAVGLRSFEGQTWTTHQIPSSLLPDGAWWPAPVSSRAVAVAPEGSVWIPLGGGIDVPLIEPPTWDYCPFETDQHGHMPWTRLCQTGGRGGGLFAQGMGVVRFDGATWTYFGEDDGLYQGLPTEIATGADGTVWAASPGVWTAPEGNFANEELVEMVGGGLFRYTGKRWEKVLDAATGSVVLGPDGAVWAGKPMSDDPWIRLVP